MSSTSLDRALAANPPCYPRACAIQNCLQKNSYNESRCTAQIDALYECCQEMYRREGLAEKNVCCPKKELLELALKQREQGSMEARMGEQRRK